MSAATLLHTSRALTSSIRYIARFSGNSTSKCWSITTKLSNGSCSNNHRNSCVTVTKQYFLSTETTAKEEKPLVPGIGRGKTSTGLVGLPVDHDAVPKMIIKYQALIDKLAASDMPPTATYYQNVEKIARYRIKAAQENLDDPEKVEELCNCGQVEELVIQAENEMKVMEMYLRNRWWELVKPIEVEYNPNPEDDHGDIEWGEAPDEIKK